MVESALITIAIVSGFLTFLSPCGIAMVPAYISYYIGRKEKKVKKYTGYRQGFEGARYGFYAALGIISIFVLIGTIITFFSNFIKFLIPWFSMVVGVILIIVGFLMLFKKTFSLNLPIQIKNLFGKIKPFRDREEKSSEFSRFYTFGIGYGFAVMSCTLPIFLIIIFNALNAGGILEGILIFLLYSGTTGIGMIVLSTSTALSKDFMLKKFRRIFPYIQKITAIVIILAGLYLIYYQITVNRVFAIFI